MAGEGQMLKAAREEKHWSLRFTEDETKIRVRYIQALEDEQYEILPGATYVKGYLRTYAKQLGLDADEIIKLYSESEKKETITVLETPDRTSYRTRPAWFRPAALGAMAVLGIVLISGIAFWSHHSPNKPANTAYSPAGLPESKPQANTGSTQSSTSQSTTPKPPAGQSTVPPVTSDTPNTPTDVAAAEQSGLNAELVFTQPCWVIVQADGKTLYQETFNPGTTKEVKATSKIELVTVGNAGGVTVTLNGKSLPSLGGDWQVVHNVIFTPDTLKTL